MIRHIKMAFIGWFFPEDPDRALAQAVTYIKQTVPGAAETSFDGVSADGDAYEGELEALWEQEWPEKAPLTTVFSSDFGLQALTRHDLDGLLGREGGRPVLEIALAGRASTMMFRRGTHRPYQDWLLGMADALGEDYMFGGDARMLGRYIKHALRGTLVPPVDVPVDKFLADFAILPGSLIPADVDFEALGVDRAQRRADGSWMINIWPDHSMKTGTAYGKVCEALNLVSLYDIPDYQ